MMRARLIGVVAMLLYLPFAGDVLGAPGSSDKTDADVVVKLPSKYASMTPVGNGRYLIFHLKEIDVIAIVDLVAGKIVHEIEDVPDGVIVAGGATKFFLVMPGQMMIQRWSLKSFKREKVSPLVIEGAPVRALMGVAAEGPLLVASQGEAKLIDPETLRPAAIEGKVLGAPGRYGYSLCVSADGKTFGGIPTGIGPVGYTRMTIADGRTHLAGFGSTSNAVRWARPTADGTLMSLPGGAFYDQNLKSLVAKQVSGATIFPAVDPNYFLAVRFAKEKDGAYKTHAMVCTTAEREVVYTIVGLKEMAPHGNTNSTHSIERNLRTDQRPRYFYLPDENRLATVHYDNQRIFLRNFDLKKALAKRGDDYLYVESIAPTSVRPGTKFSYQIKAISKKKGVRFKLESGPKGMKVVKNGRVEWKVPQDLADESVQAIVSLSDKSGNERFHSFRLNVDHPTRVEKKADGKKKPKKAPSKDKAA